jgi:hypothetical protein
MCAFHTGRQIWRELDEIEIEYFRNMSADLEIWIDDRVKGLDREFEEYTKGMSEDDIDHWGDVFSDQYHEVNKVHRRTIRESLLSSTFAFFEHRIKRMAESLERGANMQVTFVDSQGSAFGKVENYLKANFSGSKIFQSDEWQNLQDFRFLRNSIIHDGEMVGQKAVAAARRLNAAGDEPFKFDHFDRVELTSNSNLLLIDTIRSLNRSFWDEAISRYGNKG